MTSVVADQLIWPRGLCWRTSSKHRDHASITAEDITCKRSGRRQSEPRRASNARSLFLASSNKFTCTFRTGLRRVLRAARWRRIVNPNWDDAICSRSEHRCTCAVHGRSVSQPVPPRGRRGNRRTGAEDPTEGAVAVHRGCTGVRFWDRPNCPAICTGIEKNKVTPALFWVAPYGGAMQNLQICKTRRPADSRMPEVAFNHR